MTATTRVMSLLPSEDDYPADIVGLPSVIDPIIEFTDCADVDKQVKEKMKELGTLYVVDKDRIEALRPDVILTQDLCRVCSVDLMTVERIAQTMDPKPNVLNLSPTCFEDMLDNVIEVGQAVGLAKEAAIYRQELEERMARVRSAVAASASGIKPRVLFMDWVNPFIVGGHWMPQMIDMAGGVGLLNLLITDEKGRRRGDRAKRVEPEDIVAAKPDVIVIGACGLDLGTLRKEIDRLGDSEHWRAIQDTAQRIVLCDGHYYFNRPGPRLVDSLEFIAGYVNNIHELIPPDFPHEVLK
ncbi:helical backbone metal receptor [Martensiomyces pterosporus]|nr:helical backbone metal receptor [Martensiomyces pterosporus]